VMGTRLPGRTEPTTILGPSGPKSGALWRMGGIVTVAEEGRVPIVPTRYVSTPQGNALSLCAYDFAKRTCLPFGCPRLSYIGSGSCR
jgi:hypothetical protein